MKSRKDPTTNSGNVLLELASLHWIECMAAAKIKEKTGEILLDDNEEIEYEVWGPISRVELGNSTDILGFDCSPFLKKYFEYQNPGVHTNLDSRSIVELGCRAWSPDQTVSGCLMNHREGNKTCFFVKLCLKVNTNR
ncbi:hypothetical protein RMCBS344292_17496 [Rhizopus microsporus]|nr:hypothetical protein RMCBS344292_17496 [Rhizopus microsporus]